MTFQKLEFAEFCIYVHNLHVQNLHMNILKKFMSLTFVFKAFCILTRIELCFHLTCDE